MKLSLLTAPLFFFLTHVLNVEATVEVISGYTNIGKGFCKTTNDDYDRVVFYGVDSNDKCKEKCNKTDNNNNIKHVSFSYATSEVCFCQYLDGDIDINPSGSNKFMDGTARTTWNMIGNGQSAYTCYKKNVEATFEKISGYTYIGQGRCRTANGEDFERILFYNIESSDKCAEKCNETDNIHVCFTYDNPDGNQVCWCQYLDGDLDNYSGSGNKSTEGTATTTDGMTATGWVDDFCYKKDSTKAPLKAPTSPGAQGDPHFKTWSQNSFDFHGVCDLMMLSNEKFENNLGMDIHIRTKKMRMWSYISALAIRIGNDILEVIGRNGGSYILNGTTNQGNMDGALMLAGYPINYTQKSSKQQTFRFNVSTLEAIVIETWNSFVSVRFENPNSEHFKDSVGLLGSFPTGAWLARDKVTIINDANSFGQEWQVLEHEAKMFHEVEGPQQPLKKCEIPSTLNMRRRLSERTMTQNEAERACIGVEASSMDLCIFDVMATNSKLISGSY